MSPLPTQRTDLFAIAAGVAAALVGALVFDLRFGAAVLAGAMVGVFNFSVLRMLVGRLLTSTDPADKARPAVLLGIKLMALMAILYLFISVLELPALAFALGFVSTPLAIALDAIVWRNANARPEGPVNTGNEIS